MTEVTVEAKKTSPKACKLLIILDIIWTIKKPTPFDVGFEITAELL